MHGWFDGGFPTQAGKTGAPLVFTEGVVVPAGAFALATTYRDRPLLADWVYTVLVTNAVSYARSSWRLTKKNARSRSQLIFVPSPNPGLKSGPPILPPKIF